MSQADVDIQLKVWKDLAISKQVLMGAATDALGLDAECSTDELRTALNKTIQRAKDADITIIKTREEADTQIAEMQALVENSQNARVEAEAHAAEASKARKTAERQLAIGKSENAEALKKARTEVTEKQNKLKAISKALADTPENVIKKLKTLKKQKMDEARRHNQVKSKLLSTRKEKEKLEAELKTQEAQLEKSLSLIEQVRTLHNLCTEANKKIESLSEDNTDLIQVPELDETLLESLQADEKSQKDTS